MGCPETVAGSETIGTKQDQCEPDGIRVGGSRRRAGGRDGSEASVPPTPRPGRLCSCQSLLLLHPGGDLHNCSHPASLWGEGWNCAFVVVRPTASSSGCLGFHSLGCRGCCLQVSCCYCSAELLTVLTPSSSHFSQEVLHDTLGRLSTFSGVPELLMFTALDYNLLVQ